MPGRSESGRRFHGVAATIPRFRASGSTAPVSPSHPNLNMTELESDIARMIVGELDITEIALEDITSTTPLYGEGFGLDSIDILEIALLLSKKYGFELRSDNPDNEKIYASLGSLTAYVAAHRTR
jgi:acyl carrier protein